MTDNLPQKYDQKQLAADTAVFAGYLQQFGLPTDNIIASTEERMVIALNLPQLLAALPPDEKKDARYLSKFVGATAIGLFDAALNYVWNEVVLNLRKKAIVYGIDLFYDASVGGSNRSLYKDEKDLDGLKDSVLLDTCCKLELISDVVYRKIDHILTMRNEVAASHPNVESIGGYELLGWLQTCVKDVLQDRPSESAIRIRALVDNLKARQDVIDDNTLARLSTELRNLSTPHVHNLLISIFGMFVAPNTDQILRKNISQIATHVWKYADDRVKYKIGTMIDGYRTNLQQDRLQKGIEFLTLVNGRMYESLPAKIIALENLADRLDDAHDGWDNYYNEPPIMQEILQFCRISADIPKEVVPKLIKVVLRCRLGRGLSYRYGVSPGGMPLYDRFLGMMDDDGIVYCILSLFHPDINSKLGNAICQKHMESVLGILRPLAISDRLKQVVGFLLADIPNAQSANRNKVFRELSSPFINWK
ncbi:MAG: hypothetical protein HYV59_10115 [Planctomycetes bacterium]|nr:hypothetical protein [Planctomycetota bacterium]